METLILASLALLGLIVLVAILSAQHKILKELKNIHIPAPQKIEFPKIEFPKQEPPKIELPKIEIPKIELPKIEIPKIELPKIELPKIEIPKIEIPKIEMPKIEIPQANTNITAELLQSVMNSQTDLIKILQETSSLMRVNQAEFQSGLETFHKAVDKLLTQIPNDEKELNAQKEFVQKFEAAFVNVQEKAAEAINENSLRLQEILTEFLNKEQKG